MNIYDNKEYMDDIRYVAGLELPWEKLKNKSLMLSGATGLIGSFLVDVILEKNVTENLNCTIYALGRNEEKARSRFYKYFENENFFFVVYDVKQPLIREDLKNVDYILHLASNTHPILYATDPIGTITTNVFGVQNLLDFAVVHNTSRFVFASSNEIYGENRGDVEFFDESYCGYIDCNTLRAAYPESKRCGEALCQAYKAQRGLDVIIARFTRSYGPTMEFSNTRALSQFIKKVVEGEDVVLKSSGMQYFSYTYVADAVSGLLYALLVGENGEAYNIADKGSDIMLKDLAEIIAQIGGRKVVFELPDSIEAAGYSKATKARLDGFKLQSLGWKSQYDINMGMKRTIDILKSLRQ
ncbi:Nucleoside-diphosphate-sugar epimerase [Eubacterium uniforme]|uniref:Nucleoside-diphosphate-sugar epimerase n=1 Tax=Eubacterium uniforme TaxID=39495 RepID=A0A1T4VE95_9FIRM|nr:NAD-dependent epimerase/dehydratase family protein [Eubacterium uniforme]SKA62851.1 Nucleoside-diphosphate-sugar epimerase [Eubacterium uniforme]